MPSDCVVVRGLAGRGDGLEERCVSGVGVPVVFHLPLEEGITAAAALYDNVIHGRRAKVSFISKVRWPDAVLLMNATDAWMWSSAET